MDVAEDVELLHRDPGAFHRLPADMSPDLPPKWRERLPEGLHHLLAQLAQMLSLLSQIDELSRWGTASEALQRVPSFPAHVRIIGCAGGLTRRSEMLKIEEQTNLMG
jgi:hypothetical protein